MAFELSSDITTATISFQITMNGSDAVVQIPIGFDDELKRNYVLHICMAPFVGAVQSEFELTFFISIYDEKMDAFLAPLWCGKELRNFIPEAPHIARIRIALLTAIEAMISKLSPQHVRVFTYQANLPKKALRKFNLIATLFHHKGYRCGEGDPYHGRRIWMFEKK
ncbi:MAG: hypothetical protein LCH39_13815 [Proteobacteria bacterium]|nr:hypothetical protein [Pseudomonadota bacterium]